MKVTTEADLVSRLQRLDPSTNELVDQDTDLPVSIGPVPVHRNS